MTGFAKAAIAILVVGLLVVIIGSTWYLTRRSLVKALTPPTLPTKTTTTTKQNDTVPELALTATDTKGATKLQIPLVKGWNFKTIPAILAPNKGSIVFSKLASSESYYFDSLKQDYVSFLDSGDVSPGQGVVLYSQAGEVLEVVANTSSDVDETKPFTMALKTGWNLIGNPFNKDISWNPTIDTNAQKLSYDKAIEQSLVSKTYVWSPSSESYLSIGANQSVKKYQGLLIKSGGPVKLILTAE